MISDQWLLTQWLFTQEHRAAAERGADLRVAFLHRGARGADSSQRVGLQGRGTTNLQRNRRKKRRKSMGKSEKF